MQKREQMPSPLARQRLITRIGVHAAPTVASHLGILTAGNLEIPCCLGRNGITALKREGDGATPTGRFRIIGGFFRPDRIVLPTSALPMMPIQPLDGWCDAPEEANYNRKITLPFKPSHERMWREDNLYDICLVLDFNLSPRKQYAGSAIFFHLASPDRKPTEGCIAISRDHMEKLLPLIGPSTEIDVRI